MDGAKGAVDCKTLKYTKKSTQKMKISLAQIAINSFFFWTLAVRLPENTMISGI